MPNVVSEYGVDHAGYFSFLKPEWSEETAIECGDALLSYNELSEAIKARIETLRHIIVGGVFVTIEKTKSIEYIIDLVSVLSMGGIVVPIDNAWPNMRQQKIIDLVSPAIRLLPERDYISGKTSKNLNYFLKKDDDHPAYVFFTSGSTGEPKAILGSLNGLFDFIKWQGSEFDIGTKDRVSFLTAVGFDVSLRDILLPLCHGATLVIPEDDEVNNPQKTLSWLAAKGITHVHAVPSIVKMWVRANFTGDFSLRNLFLAGEKLTSTTILEISDAFSNIDEIVNLYGPTETTLAKFFNRVPVTDSVNGLQKNIPVGKPIPNASFFLRENGAIDVDWWESSTERKSNGEVILITKNASFGYLNSEENELKFHMYSNGEIAYRTGDLGEINEDGNLIILGRVDDEIKINGVRIHPLEVERVILSAPMIEDAVVVTSKVKSDEPRLAVFWIASEACGMNDKSPREYVQSYLPQAMVPTIWKQLDKLPLNENGKINRKKLEEWGYSSNQSKSAEAGDALAVWVVNVISEILSISIPNIGDDFFALGGTSLHVAFLIGKIENEHNRVVEFLQIFESSLIEEIIETVRSAPCKKELKIRSVPTLESYPLSPQQRRWWNIYLPEKNRSWATMVKPIMLTGSYTTDTVRQAIYDIVSVQDSMWIFFTQDGDKLRQHVVENIAENDIDVLYHDIQSESEDIQSEKLDKIRLSIANKEIDPLNWPLFSANLIALSPNKMCLIFAIHHMVSDGFSVGLIEDALRKKLEHNISYSPDMSFNYIAYASWANEEKKAYGKSSPAEKYWQKLFKDPYEKVIFPEKWVGRDHDRGMGYCHRVPDDLRENVIATARREKLTEFNIYLAAKFLAWHKILNRNDIVIGTPAAGRDVPGTEKVLGNFISLVCMRSQTPNPHNLCEYTHQIMRSVAKAMTYQGYQYDTLVKSLGLSLEQNRFPLTTIFISYLNFETLRSQPLPENELKHSDLGFAVKFDLMSYVREHKDATSLQVQYRNNLFDKSDIEAFIQQWLLSIDDIVSFRI